MPNYPASACCSRENMHQVAEKAEEWRWEAELHDKIFVIVDYDKDE
jgi:hypothetical protein